MPLSMYSLSVPVFTHHLKCLSSILKKGEAHASDKEFDPLNLLNYRLFPDMFPLSKQVQIASDMVKGGVARLAGVESPVYEDNESSFAELQDRLAKTIEFISNVPSDQIEGTQEKLITLNIRGTTLEFSGERYLNHWVVPNLMFHVTTSYSILRHNGVELGKRDFLVPGS